MIVSQTGLKNEKGEDVYVTDEMVNRIFNEQSIGENKKKAEETVKGVSKEQIHILRARAKRDLFFLCTGILGNTRLSVDLHGNLCEHIRKTEYPSETNHNRFREYLLARGNFKSTVITIGHSIQVVLPYTEEDRQHDEDSSPLPWPNNLGTDCRLLIAHETHESSARFLYAITNHFTNNPVLMALFPEAVPQVRKHRVNKWELELPRTTTGNPEPTIDTLGVGGKSQGRHYNYIKLDDIYGDKARDSNAESTTTKEWFDNIQSFFSVFLKDKLDLIGTRYSFDDIYSHAHAAYGTQLIKYIRKIEEPDPANPGQTRITFPEEFTKESLEIIKKNKKVFNSQYLNDPDALSGGFDPEDQRFFYWLSPITIAVMDGKSKTTINVRDLDICIIIDPGQSKTGGFVITGMDHLKRIFVLVSIKLELKPPQLTDLVFKSVVKWQPRTVAIESDFFMAVFEHWWMSEMTLRGIRFSITPVYTKKVQKDDRIEGLMNYFAAHQIFFNEAQTDILEEYKLWRKSKDIHILDALAYGPRIWRPGFAPGTRAEIYAGTGSEGDGRDVQTGYSSID